MSPEGKVCHKETGTAMVRGEKKYKITGVCDTFGVESFGEK